MKYCECTEHQKKRPQGKHQFSVVSVKCMLLFSCNNFHFYATLYSDRMCTDRFVNAYFCNAVKFKDVNTDLF